MWGGHLKTKRKTNFILNAQTKNLLNSFAQFYFYIFGFAISHDTYT